MGDETTGALSLPGSDSVMPSQDQMAAVSTPQPQVVNPATDTTNNAPAAPADKNWHGKGFLGKVFSPLVNAAGHDTTTSVDNNGNVNVDMTAASPGTLFKHLLGGALTGLAAATTKRGVGFGGGAGLGFEGEQQNVQEQADRQRAQAIQAAQMKQQAQKSQDEHSSAQDESHLRASEIAYSNAQTAQLGFNMAKQSQEFQEGVMKQQSDARDYFLKNGGSIVKQGLTYAQVQQEMAADKSLTHSMHGLLTGETPVLDASGKQVMEAATDPSGNPILNASTKQPVMRPKMSYTFDLVQTPDDHVLTKQDIKRYSQAGLQGFDQGTVKPGQTIAGSRWFNLENQYQSKQLQTLSLDEKKAAIERDKASASAEIERSKDLVEDIADKKLRKQTQLDYGEALRTNNNDPQKAAAWLKANKPQSFDALDAAEAQELVQNPYVKNADGVTMSPRQRLFSAQPSVANGAIPAGAMVAVNPKTQETLFSTDGGKTWKSPDTKASGAQKTVKPGFNGQFDTDATSGVKNIVSGVETAAPLIANAVQ